MVLAASAAAGAVKGGAVVTLTGSNFVDSAFLAFSLGGEALPFVLVRPARGGEMSCVVGSWWQ